MFRYKLQGKESSECRAMSAESKDKNITQRRKDTMAQSVTTVKLDMERFRSTNILSIASIGSVLSIASAGSILSIGSTGSILSIGSTGSVLSIGSMFSVASMFSVLSVGRIFGFLKFGRKRRKSR